MTKMNLKEKFARARHPARKSPLPFGVDWLATLFYHYTKLGVKV
jgi:hypothetical protein